MRLERDDSRLAPLLDYTRRLGVMQAHIGGDWMEQVARGDAPPRDGLYGFLFHEGIGSLLTPEHRREKPRFPQMEIKECFYNARVVALSHYWDDDCVYCEGVAIKMGLGVMIDHAWVLDRDGRVHDITWREDGEPTDWVYLGVPLITEYINDRLFNEEVWAPRCRRGVFAQPGSFLQDHEAGFPIQNRAIPEEDWKVSEDWFSGT